MTFRQFAYRNVIRNRRVYTAFFMASVFSVMVFFLYSMLLFHPSIENRFIREIALFGMGAAEIILYIFTLFFLFYSMRAFLQARSKEFGILLHLGMQKRQLHRLIFLETLLIGTASIVAGTFLGFLFAKFFLMVVNQIVLLPSLPMYVSWEPFVLTIGAFLSLFFIISLIAPHFIPTDQVGELIRRETVDDGHTQFSNVRAAMGLVLLAISYFMAANTSNLIVIGLSFILPPIATLGTYYFFTDSLPFLLHLFRKRKKFYWRHFWLLSLSEGMVRLKENARMFFIVTIVSTIAFMSVGILASLTSFASQYREMNPLGLVYQSKPQNQLEQRHIAQLIQELDEEQLDFTLVRFPVLEQTSSFTEFNVSILKLSNVNELAASFGYPTIDLRKGSALFLPPSSSYYERLQNRLVQTTLKESNLSIQIDGAYPYDLFPSQAFGTNAIVLNDTDFELLVKAEFDPIYTYYAFNIPNWQATKEIGLLLNQSVSESFIAGNYNELPYYFDNPGANYAVIRTTFSLLLFIGLLLAAVLFLAAGSFIYFRLYTSLDRDRKQFDMLRRMGLTDREFKRVVNRQLIPQFFFPWGVAFVHSSFAFLSLQVLWDALAEISIVKEVLLVLGGFTILQLIYFYLIRWRYLAHVKAV